jgi:hypothetical protein
MAFVVKDRVQETTTTAGTGTVTLGGAVLGFQTFAIIGDGNTTYYAIANPTTGEWEVGLGTYTASGTTLSRTTVFESSNSGSLVNFAAGSKNVFCTYPAERAVYLDAAGSAVTVLDIGTLGASTANITTANITSGTVSTTPTNNTDIVNKAYADAIASGIHFHEAVALATTTTLPANTYNNGTSGVGATLTGNANGALSVDSTLTVVTERILVKNEAAGANNGVYTVTQVGSAGTPYILTRATDFDTVGTGVDQIDEGDFFLVTSGTANVNTAWVQQTAPPITIGTTAIVFQQFSAPITYTAGTGLSESPTYTFNIANTGTAGTYGSASSVPVFTTNAQGQVTGVSPTGIAISSAAVSGLAASATTDTTDASNITTGTLGTSRLSGSYTGVTGVGTLTAGTWNATAIGAVYGGTGLTSYAVGDLLYADTTTSLATLADAAVGNALISGGVSANPSWGKIGLATHVSGTLPIANGGTGSTSTTFVDLATNVTGTLPVGNGGTGAATFTANNVLLGNGTSALQVVAPGTNGNVLQSNGTTWVSASAPSTMVYPGAGIPNSTGTSWATSYSTTGSGTVVALATSPSFTTPILGTPQSGNFSTGTFTWPTFNQNTTGNAATATTATTLSSGQTNWSGTGVLGNVVGLMAWKNYGNSHVIFDASNSTSPSGTSVNNTNSTGAWIATYPTLMGWNGANTYGVRVDSARVSDSTSGNAATATTATNQSGGTVSATTGAFSSTITSSFAPAAINTTTPGLTNYGQVFNGTSSTNNAQALTWTWNSGGGAQAGIYVQSSGAFGTKMYLATTDDFATGAKTAVTIDHTGAVTLNRSSLSIGSGNYARFGPNPTWAATLQVGGDGVNGITRTASFASVVTTDGNLHLDSGTSKAMYLNYYAGTGGIVFGNGASGTAGSISAAGALSVSTVNGFTPTASIASNRLVATDANGYIFTNYFNSTDNAISSGVTAIMAKQGDNYYRSASAAAVASFINGQSILATQITNAGTGIYAASSGTSYSNVVCVREAGNGGAGASAPRLGFHWGGVVASSIAIETSGRIAITNNPGTGYEAFVCGTFTSPQIATNTTTTYGGATQSASKNGYFGYLMGTSTNHLNAMADASGNGGFYRESNGVWPLYYLVSNGGIGIMTSTTSSSYAMYVAGSIYATANVVAYSDRRAKKDVVTIDNALEKTNKLRGVYYKKIEEDIKDEAHHDKRQMGVIAQEVLEIAPEVVTYDKENDKYGVAYANMAGLFIEAIKELTDKVATLEAKLEQSIKDKS